MTQAIPKPVTFEEFVDWLISKFQNSDRIISQTFPELNLTPNQIFQAGVV
jgi:Uma2 family endonuclease